MHSKPERTALSQTDGHSANRIENSGNIYFYLFSFLKLQNKTEQEALYYSGDHIHTYTRT